MDVEDLELFKDTFGLSNKIKVTSNVTVTFAAEYYYYHHYYYSKVMKLLFQCVMTMTIFVTSRNQQADIQQHTYNSIGKMCKGMKVCRV